MLFFAYFASGKLKNYFKACHESGFYLGNR